VEIAKEVLEVLRWTINIPDHHTLLIGLYYKRNKFDPNIFKNWEYWEFQEGEIQRNLQFEISNFYPEYKFVNIKKFQDKYGFIGVPKIDLVLKNNTEDKFLIIE